MARRVRQIRPQLEPLSRAALQVLHRLEQVVGRIIGTAMVKHACSKAQLDPATLTPDQIPHLIPSIASSLAQYDRSTEVVEELRRLAADSGGPR